MDNIRIVLLRLEGPFQSWGEHSRFDYRDSADFPTKSGIVGMIGCAMGLERGSARLEDISYAIHIGVRCDRRGNISQDYHTVSSNSKILNAKAKPRCDTIVTHRTYIEDGSFLVAISSDDETLNSIVAALSNPIWPIYLGRKSCVPSVPVLVRDTMEFTGIEDALENEPLQKRHSNIIAFEMESSDGSGVLRPDNLVNASKRLFCGRRVIRKTLVKE